MLYEIKVKAKTCPIIEVHREMTMSIRVRKRYNQYFPLKSDIQIWNLCQGISLK